MAKAENKDKQGLEENARWQDRIAVAKRRQDEWKSDSGVETYISRYKNKYDVMVSGKKAPIINEVYAYVQSAVAGLYFKDPYITVNAKKKSSVLSAYIIEQALNYTWRELRQKEEIEYEIIDAILTGFAWHKTGLNVEADEYGGEVKLKGERLYSQRVPWSDILFNIASKRPPHDCIWMAHRIVKPLEEIKKKYKIADLKGGPYPDLTKGEVEKARFKDDIQFVTLWEIWDWDKKEVLLIAEGYGKTLKKTKWPDYQEHFPFDMLWFNCVPDEAYPMSDIAPWNDQITEKIKVVGMLLNHMKRWNRQLFIKGGILTEEQKQEFLNGNDGAVIDTNQSDLDKNMKFVDFGQFNPDIFGVVNIIDQIKNVVNGNPEINKGGQTRTSTRTLGELEMISAGSKSREDKKTDRLETHIENITRQMVAHMQANFDLDQIVKITGKAPQEIIEALQDKYVPETGEIVFTKEDIQGEYDIDVKAGSTLPLDKQSRMMVFDTVLRTLAPNIQFVAGSPLGQALISGLLRDYDIPELQVAFERELEMAAQAAQAQSANAQLEASKVAAEAQKREAQAHNVDVDSEMKMQEMISPARIKMLVEGEPEKNTPSKK